MLDKAEYSAFQSTLNSPIVSYRIVYWLVHFFEAHSHQTKYQDEVSVMKTVSASITQGSAIGPASYVVNSSDLNAISEGNALCKYADDRPTYVIIPAVNVDTRSDELNHISDWAQNNNLKLNLA